MSASADMTLMFRMLPQAEERIWKKTVIEAVPHEGLHPTTTQCAGSPMTDGKHLYAYFGSRGLHCRTSIAMTCDDEIVFSQKPFEKIYLASTTKTKTALP